MSEEQEEKLKQMKEIIATQGLTEDPRYNDYYLLRFLRARDFDMEEVMKMFTAFLEWRKEVGADDALSVRQVTLENSD